MKAVKSILSLGTIKNLTCNIDNKKLEREILRIILLKAIQSYV